MWPWIKKSSKEQLKDRLKVVLAYDRAHIAPGVIEALKAELMDVLRKYFPEERDLEVLVETIDDKISLHADVPIRP